MRLFPKQLYLPLLIFGSALIATAQQPGALPPDLDPEIWGCANHPYIAVMEVQNTPFTQESQPGQDHATRVNVYRSTSGAVRTDAFYANGLPMASELQNPAVQEVTMLNAVEKAAYEIPQAIPDRSRASEFWTVSLLPARNILGMEATGWRYVHKLQSKENTPGNSATVVEDDWFAPSACMIVERHVTNPLKGSRYERIIKLDLREPDPKLFEVPEGYTVHTVDGH